MLKIGFVINYYAKKRLCKKLREKDLMKKISSEIMDGKKLFITLCTFIDIEYVNV